MPEQIPSYRLYREESGESGDFWIHCETIPERTHLHNWEISQHRHDSFFQIFWLSAGEGEIAEADRIRHLRAPCAIFIPAGAVHGFRYSRDIDGLVVTALADRLRALAATDRHIAGFLGATQIVQLDVNDADAAFAVDCIGRLHRELHGRSAGRMLLLEPLATGALVALARTSGRADEADSQLGDRDQARMEALATMIAAGFREHRLVTHYADALGLSATHLNRLARRATGQTVQNLIDAQVIEAARRDLVFTPSPVQSIAYSLGFSDPAYFSRFFKRRTGMSPGRFRQAERQRFATR